MKKRTGKMISLSLAVAMAMTAAPVTVLAVNEPVQNMGSIEQTTAQNEGEKETGTTTVDTKEEEEPATVVAAPVVYGALTAGDAEAEEAVTLGDATTREVTSQESLEKAIQDAKNGDIKTIKLGNNIILTNVDRNIPENNAVITLPEGVILDGDGNSIIAREDWDDSVKNHLVGILDSSAEIRNVTITGNDKTRHGINAYGKNNNATLTLNSVAITNCGTAGIVVNGAKVVADKITTSGNKWGAINVGDQAGSKLTLTNGNFDETQKIWSEYSSTNASTNIEVDGLNTVAGVMINEKGAEVPFTYYTNDALELAEFLQAEAYNETSKTIYASFATALNNAEENDTIILANNASLTETANITKSIVIDGNGHTITGDNNKAYSAFKITGGSFEIKNATLTDFGGNVYTKQETAVFYVAAGANSFTADTVIIKNFNRMGISVADGTYDIKNCTIECENDYHAPDKPTLTKGIRIGYAEGCEATGTISETTITGAVVHPDWSASAIEVFYNGNATVDDCTIEGCDYGIWVDNYWYPENAKDSKASVKVTGNTTITAKNPTNEDNSAIIIYGKDGDKGGEITTDVVIESGTFNGQIKVTDDNESNDKNTISVSGGKFKNAGEQLKDFVAPGSNLKPGSDGGFTVSKKSSGSHKFDNYITVITPKNGEVSVSDDWAYVGDKVTLTVTPDKGYVVDKIEIVDAEGNKLEAKKVDDKDNEYTFKVKNSDVTVTVTFKEEGKTTEDTDKEEGKDEETTETTKLNFTDVKESDWFFKGVEYVVDKGIMSGVSENEFAPSGKLTRAMLVQMLYNMESRPACDAENAFIDVPVGQWYTDAVIWANDEKIVSGMGDGLFAPNMEITREQMVVMLYNYAKYKGYDVTASADLSKFADNASVSTWAQPAMQWAVAEGYISGMGDSQLAPHGTATRAEIASVIMRFMEATAETAETAE